MADTIEMQDIRGLDVDKAVKGFALVDYVFKKDCQVSSMTGDSIRWYQETAADLEASAPQKVANIAPLSTFPTLEVSWTRQTTYPRKYAAEGFLSMEDIKSADIDVLARTLRRLTRAVVKQVDTRIYTIMTDGVAGTSGISTASANGINVIHTSGAWGVATSNPILDIMNAKKQIQTYNYNAEGASLYMSPTTHMYLLNWIIGTKGSSIPSFSSSKVESGVILNLLGVNIKVSNNVTGTSGAAVMIIPQEACTWKTYQDTTSRVIDEPGIGSKIRVWEIGEGYLTDPRAVTLIKGTDSDD